MKTKMINGETQIIERRATPFGRMVLESVYGTKSERFASDHVTYVVKNETYGISHAKRVVLRITEINFESACEAIEKDLLDFEISRRQAFIDHVKKTNAISMVGRLMRSNGRGEYYDALFSQQNKGDLYAAEAKTNRG